MCALEMPAQNRTRNEKFFYGNSKRMASKRKINRTKQRRKAPEMRTIWSGITVTLRLLRALSLSGRLLSCVVQIVKLGSQLSDEVKRQNSAIPWCVIKDTRNYYVHVYGAIDIPSVWKTLNHVIPTVKSACEAILAV